jgi:hypothetical protein
MPFQFFEFNIKIKTKLAKIQTIYIMIATWKGRIIPSLTPIFPQLNLRNSLKFRCFFMQPQTYNKNNKNPL